MTQWSNPRWHTLRSFGSTRVIFSCKQWAVYFLVKISDDRYWSCWQLDHSLFVCVCACVPACMCESVCSRSLAERKCIMPEHWPHVQEQALSVPVTALSPPVRDKCVHKHEHVNWHIFRKIRKQNTDTHTHWPLLWPTNDVGTQVLASVQLLMEGGIFLDYFLTALAVWNTNLNKCYCI